MPERFAAQRYPERVTEMVLLSCTMTRPSDVHWLYHEAGRFFPEQWHRYAGQHLLRNDRQESRTFQQMVSASE